MHQPLDVTQLQGALQVLGQAVMTVHSAASNREEYLRRPDLGRRLDEPSRQKLQALELADYDAYRYFQPAGNDPHLKRKAKGREGKVPLTIGMLYAAIRSGHWDTQSLEA